MNENDRELQSLSEVWKSGETQSAEPLRRLVRAKRRTLALVVAGEVALVAAFFALSLYVVRDGVVPWEVVWLVSLWTFVAIAVGFAWWNRRGTWQPLGDSVAEYVRLSRLRCERQRTTVRLVLLLFVAETAAVVAQLAWFDRLTVLAVVLLAAGGTVVAGWSLYTHRRVERELRLIGEQEELARGDE